MKSPAGQWTRCRDIDLVRSLAYFRRCGIFNAGRNARAQGRSSKRGQQAAAVHRHVISLSIANCRKTGACGLMFGWLRRICRMSTSKAVALDCRLVRLPPAQANDRFGSLSATELRGRRRRVLLSKRTPKTRFSEKPASIDKNDRVGKPLVRYFEVAATSAPPLFGFTFIVKAMVADLDRAAGAPKRTASRSLGQVGGAGLRRQQAASSCNRSR
jgi:hypothetical protein